MFTECVFYIFYFINLNTWLAGLIIFVFEASFCLEFTVVIVGVGIEADCLGLREPAATAANEIGRTGAVDLVVVFWIRFLGGITATAVVAIGLLTLDNCLACVFFGKFGMASFGCFDRIWAMLLELSFSSEKSSRPSLLSCFGIDNTAMEEVPTVHC